MSHTNYKQMIEDYKKEVVEKCWNLPDLVVYSQRLSINQEEIIKSFLKSSYIKSLNNEIEYLEKIDVSGGGSGRRLKEQLLSYLLAQRKLIEEE